MIGICGIGFVGNALVKAFEKKNIELKKYDKYKNGGIGAIEDLLECEIIFLCLPTLFSDEKKEYDKSAIYEVCAYLSEKFKGLVVCKSTVEPGTCKNISSDFNLRVVHNPEFLTARTACEDFENQKHIVIGGENSDTKIVETFYRKHWKDADISKCSYEESELMKLGVNCFYSVKIQFFNELYSLSQKYDGANYDNVIKMMLKNDWIAPHHVNVPGPDGQMSYGGMCFPKDTNALCQAMSKMGTPNAVLKATIDERNSMRND
jgi:nucleotide sugar dehydrogenase